MIRKLQLRFIIIATAAMLFVLAALTGLVNSSNYQNAVRNVYQYCDFIAKNGGVLPTEANENSSGSEEPDFTAEDTYRLRYFTVFLDDNGNVLKTNLKRIAAVKESDISSFVNNALRRNNENGHFSYKNSEYAFSAPGADKGMPKLIVFMDCTNEILYAANFRVNSLFFGLTLLLFFVVVVSFYSKRAMQPIIKNMESQKQFITNASHELKTPLAVISANAEVLEMTNGESEWTKSIRNQVNRLNSLIANLITLSKLGETDKKDLYDVDVSSVIKACCEDYKTVFEQKGLSFDYSVSENIHALATKEGVGEIANILLDNASKYCDDGGRVSLRLSHKSSSKGVRLSVSNTYKDGKDTDYTRFFERFYREDTSHNSENAGYGIGLSMAQGIVQDYRGRISVSFKDEDIIFTVTLP